ncbi:DUF5131 family protein [Coraliomargarita parva]|uniref:DUF5131 family protein n=1 Tax=Coraliomargarita parva TaxID=3014050 RepID=UPI0022B4C8AE|nr:DUF5131 family protein [Coraliomargarita parva]
MQITKIQWCDGTINPVMGCDGCPLRLSDRAVCSEIENRLRCEVENITKESIQGILTSYIVDEDPNRRRRIENSIANAGISGLKKNQLRLMTQRIYSQTSACYAGKVIDAVGIHRQGHPDRFEDVTLYPGRMETAARTRPLLGLDRTNKPWLNGFPRLWFVSDMGDALSNGVSFEYLENEIVDVATSPNGSRHVWLWLTKRPRRMLEFAEYLRSRGKEWPINVVPMSSVIDQRMARQVDYLRQVPAVCRGLSVEPLREPVNLDLTGIDWVIVGGESGPQAADFDLQWALDLKDECERKGVAFFVKQLGANPIFNGERLTLKDSHGGDWDEWPDRLRVRSLPEKFKDLVL